MSCCTHRMVLIAILVVSSLTFKGGAGPEGPFTGVLAAFLLYRNVSTIYSALLFLVIRTIGECSGGTYSDMICRRYRGKCEQEEGFAGKELHD